METTKMNLMTDARACTNIANLAKDKIKANVLPEVEKDLDISEKISIIFLINSKDSLLKCFEQIAELLKRNKDGMLQEWLESSPNENWEEQLLEALLIIKNIEIIKKLGFSEEEKLIFETRYQIRERLISPNLNRVLKTLYSLCEDLNLDQTKALVKKFQTPEIGSEELELFLLFWIQKGFISVSGDKGQLNNLLSALRKINYSKDNIYADLEYLNIQDENPRNVQDAENRANDNSLLLVVENKNPNPPRNDNPRPENEIYDFEKGLCVIINQEKFNKVPLTNYRERTGTAADVSRLKSTFGDFGYEIQLKENLTKPEVIEELRRIGRYTKKEHDCIVLVILSHGEEGPASIFYISKFISGTFVTSDCKKVKVERVREEICTPTLKGVVKIVIIQACQGEKLGQEVPCGPSEVETPLKPELSSDGPLFRISEIPPQDNIRFLDFAIFIATIGDYRSVRNVKEGSWFIQTLCKVLGESDEIEWEDCSRKVKNLVSEKRGIVDGIKDVVQVPETRYNTLRLKFFFRKKREDRCKSEP